MERSSPFRLFSLDDPLRARPVDGALEALESSYNLIGVLGAGNFGVVLKLSDSEKGAHLAVKISAVEHALPTLEVTSKLRRVVDATAVFVPTLAWTVADGIPRDWADRIRLVHPVQLEHLQRNGLLVFVFMALAPYEFTDIVLLPYEYRALFFLLLQGLYVARKEIAFEHHDLHARNIMLHDVKKTSTLSVQVGGPVFRVTGINFVPRVIDFDFAEFGPEQEQEPASSEQQANAPRYTELRPGKLQPIPVPELVRVLNAFIQHTKAKSSDLYVEFLDLRRDPMWIAAVAESRFEYKALVRFLLHHPFLEPVRERAGHPAGNFNVNARLGDSVDLHRCVRCGVDTIRHWENTSIYFCDQACSKTMPGFAAMAPRSQ